MSEIEQLYHIFTSLTPNSGEKIQRQKYWGPKWEWWGKRAEKRKAKIPKTNRASSFLFLGPTCLSSTLHRQIEAMSRGISCPSGPENSNFFMGTRLHPLFSPPEIRITTPRSCQPFLPPFIFILPIISFLFLPFFFFILYFPRALLLSLLTILTPLPPLSSCFKSLCPLNGYIMNLKFNLQIVSLQLKVLLAFF